MTCIVGLIHDGKTYIGGDAAGCSPHTGDITVRVEPKVFFKGPYVFGYTTSFRMGQLLEWVIPGPEEKKGLGDLRGHLITTWIPVLRQWLKHEGYMHIHEGVEHAGTFLVGYKGQLCGVYGDMQVAVSTDGYLSVGIGDAVALGVLYATKKSKMKPIDRVTLALKAAAHHNMCVREPFTIIQS